MKTFIQPSDFTRVNADVNGNPRYACHFLKLLTEQDKNSIRENFGASLDRNPLLFTEYCYDEAALKAKNLGGKKYRGKNYGGGIVFQSYSLEHTCNRINELLNA